MNYSLITNERYPVPCIQTHNGEWVAIPRNARAWRPSNIQQLKEFVSVPTDAEVSREH